jgi:acetylornithine deacetylase/succinyl-diaminopimelate desuccinylase-like protein
VPFLIPGFTDAKHYDKIGIKTFGFAPTKLPPDLNFGALYHGHNERLPLSALGFGLEVLWDVIQKNCL